MEMAHKNKMKGVVAVAVAVVVLVVAVGGGGGGVTAQVLHVVGGDRGWELSNIIGDWSSGRVFRVGDTICFAYSTGQDSIVELGSLEEYESCDLSNPIRMFTDGLDKISLEGEGIRYFASGNIDNCKKGLKLPINVQPQVFGPSSAESPLGYWPQNAESPIVEGPSQETKQAQSPLMGQEYGPTSSFSSAESPLGYWANNAESPIVYGPSMETDQGQSPLMGQGYGPTSYLSSAESPYGYWPKDAASPIVDGPSMETNQAQSPSMGQEYGPTTSFSSAESPLISGSEGPTPSFPFSFQQFSEHKQTKNSLMDGKDGPTSMNSHNGLPIIGQKKWAKRLSEKTVDGPKSLSAPINLSGLFGLWAVGLLLHAINFF